MGQSQTSASSPNELSDQLSQLEVEKLDAVFGFDLDAKQEEPDVKEYLENLKVHLAKYFSSQICDRIATIFQDQIVYSSANSNVKERFIARAASLTHGAYQDMVDLIFQLLKDNDNGVSPSTLKLFVGDVVQCLSCHATAKVVGTSQASSQRFSEMLFPDQCDHIDLQSLQRRFENISNAAELCQTAFKVVFFGTFPMTSSEMSGLTPELIPRLVHPEKITLNKENTLLHLSDVMFLNSNLPLELQHKWRFIYSSNLQGESFSKLSSLITDKGPLLIIVRDQGGNVFGGFISTNLTFSSQFQGDERSFLFSISPSYGIFTATGYNKHFVYMNIGQETIPNGLAMGGQHNYFGFWLSTEFGKGHSKAKPKSTTFGNPQLSSTEDFMIDTVEAWAVGDEPKHEENPEEARSVIDKNPDVVAILRIAGKEPASEGVRESSTTPSQPETSSLHLPHDPMDYP